jgi:ribonuclease P protein component
MEAGPAQTKASQGTKAGTVKQADILRVRREGRMVQGRGLRIFTDHQQPQLCVITIAGIVGNAVCRNKIRRRIRAILQKKSLPPQVVIVVDPNLDASFWSLKAQIDALLS